MSTRIGIDLGTTNSAVAMLYDDGPSLVPRGAMDPIFEPSVVFFDQRSEDWIAGGDADQAFAHSVRSIKRLMGRTHSDAMAQEAQRHFGSRSQKLVKLHHDDLQLQLLHDDGHQVAAVWPPQVFAHVLKHLKTQAESALGANVEAVVTVPAYFADAHRAATLEAARLAGLTVLEPLLDEPTAAALAFSRIVGLAVGEPLLVVDWGGGTLDVTVLVSDGNGFTQMAIDGDLNLGGDDLDLALADQILNRKQLSLDLLQDPVNRYNLLKEVRSVKHRLSENAMGTVNCVLKTAGIGAIVINEPVTRDDFERLARPFLDRVAAIVGRCISHRDVAASEIRNVLLVGGSTLIPATRAQIQALLPHASLRTELNPMHAVALGAAVYAEMQRDRVARICPYGYAVLTGSGSSDLIGRDQEVPTPQHLPYRITPALVTAYDNQTVYRVTLQRFTKISESVMEVSRIASMRVVGRHPPQPKGTPVECEFWLDQNKVLRGRSQIEGCEPVNMSSISLSELGPRAVFTQLSDKCLDAEALIEGNAERTTPLLTRLTEVWNDSNDALNTKSVEDSKRCLVALEELLEQARSAAGEAPGPITGERERQRVLGWARFHEQTLLPKFGDLLEKDTLTAAVEAITRIRIMFRIGASGEEMTRQLQVLERLLEHSRSGHILMAYRDGHVVGVPAGLTNQIERLCDQACSELRQPPAARGVVAAQALKAKSAEAREQWLAWQASAGLSFVAPDLVRGQGNDGGI